MSEFANIQALENRLWAAADQLRANTGLTSQEYSRPVLGLIFLRYAEYRYQQASQRIAEKQSKRRRSASNDLKTAIQAEGAMYVPEAALFSNLLEQPEGEDLGKAVNDAMKALEAENEAIKDTLPKTYTRFDNDILASLLKNFANIRFDFGSDVFGRIYEYFLTQFARAEGQGGGEFFTPSPLVRLIAEIIEPYHGKVFDPACGSGGMFVQSAAFVEGHNHNAGDELSCFGQEKTGDTVRLAKMNLAVHGLQGDIKEGNSYYDDLHSCAGQFDFVMANPPFNVDAIQKERLQDDKARFPFGMPRTDNGNYLWIQLFHAALNEKGRAGFVMANSASDARASEMEIRKQLIQTGAVDVMVAISSNFFYTVTLPCSLWFFDKGKAHLPPLHQGGDSMEGGGRVTQEAKAEDRGEGEIHRGSNTVLFIDARHVYRQVTRAVRDFNSEQLNFIANIVRLYRGEQPDNTYLENHPDDENGGEWSIENHFTEGGYQDIPGLCKVATLQEIEEQGWSLNPGRYVGVAKEEEESDEIFAEKLETLQEELEVLNAEAHELEQVIAGNVVRILGAVT
ncbi:MAG: SAM-dependent DNA methyltransferase [Chloroflexi bacterium]|jgi:type I restriction enzyme M protein|nr:SAM-dependent DNA methyltransferase [Candidatus Neomarinimicrobiota bacterium]MBT6079105.1 SAM-dependent DNA methyltransferase [Gammaproteobacteria bacterium]MBT7080582.1 SAM-dependent DNA methyltransferase [Chloroflexota bacterium]MBT7830439.1 SAM-dependent DNA methyltransferase [Candidatus Neomarinimicrobiota bacterium]